MDVNLETFLLTIGVTFNGVGNLLYLLTNISDSTINPFCSFPGSGMSNFLFLILKASRRVRSVKNTTQLDERKITESLIISRSLYQNITH